MWHVMYRDSNIIMGYQRDTNGFIGVKLFKIMTELLEAASGSPRLFIDEQRTKIEQDLRRHWTDYFRSKIGFNAQVTDLPTKSVTDDFYGMECPHCKSTHTFVHETSTSWTSEGARINLKGSCINCSVNFEMTVSRID